VTLKKDRSNEDLNVKSDDGSNDKLLRSRDEEKKKAAGKVREKQAKLT